MEIRRKLGPRGKSEVFVTGLTERERGEFGRLSRPNVTTGERRQGKEELLRREGFVVEHDEEIWVWG